MLYMLYYKHKHAKHCLYTLYLLYISYLYIYQHLARLFGMLYNYPAVHFNWNMFMKKTL